VQDGRAEWSYVEHGPLLSTFGRLPVAVAFLRCSSHLLLFGPWFISLCAPPPDFAHLPTAANHGCGDAMTSGRTCPLVVLIVRARWNCASEQFLGLPDPGETLVERVGSENPSPSLPKS
jgi:hypothetical protein